MMMVMMMEMMMMMEMAMMTMTMTAETAPAATRVPTAAPGTPSMHGRWPARDDPA